MKKNKNKFYGPFVWMGFNCLKAKATSGFRSIFLFSQPIFSYLARKSWYQNNIKKKKDFFP